MYHKGLFYLSKLLQKKRNYLWLVFNLMYIFQAHVAAIGHAPKALLVKHLVLAPMI